MSKKVKDYIMLTYYISKFIKYTDEIENIVIKLVFNHNYEHNLCFRYGRQWSVPIKWNAAVPAASH